MRKSMVLGLMALAIAAGPISAADVHDKVSRLPPLPQPLDPILQQMYAARGSAGGAVINLSLARGHAPKLAKAAEVSAFAIRFDTVTPRKLVELVIYRTAQIVGSDYELNQHKPMMKMCGYSDQQIADIANWKGSALFDDKQAALLGFVEQMTNRGEVDDATYAKLEKFFTPQEIVEVTYTVGSYYSTALFLKALKVEIEKDGRLTVAGKC